METQHSQLPKFDEEKMSKINREINRIIKILGIGIGGLIGSTPFIADYNYKHTEKYDVPSVVISERYGGVRDGSTYSFTMDTEYGKKLVQVWEVNGGHIVRFSIEFPYIKIVEERPLPKEFIDDLIEPETKVVVEKIPDYSLDDKVYSVRANRIKVINK